MLFTARLSVEIYLAVAFVGRVQDPGSANPTPTPRSSTIESGPMDCAVITTSKKIYFSVVTVCQGMRIRHTKWNVSTESVL